MMMMSVLYGFYSAMDDIRQNLLYRCRSSCILFL